MEKSIREYITESLSDENKKRLISLLDRISDDDFDRIYRTIDTSISGTDKEFLTNLEDFVRRHGLETIDFGRKNTTASTLISIFGANNHIGILKSIVENNGVMSIKDLMGMRKPENGVKLNNIFDIARNCKFGDWSDEAITIAEMVNRKGSTAVGMFEILLQFMLQEGCNPKVGDVGLSNGETLEVKSVSKSEKGSFSGGHVAGQTTNGEIKQCREIYKYIDRHAFDDKYGRIDYFQGSPNNYTKLLEMAKDNEIGEREILEIVFRSLLYQYGIIGIKDADAKGFWNLMDEFCNHIIDNKMSKDSFYDAIGAVQLFLYKIIEKFNYIIFTYIDKNEKDTNSGKFYLYNDADFNRKDYLTMILNKLSFKNPDSPSSTQGRTGKVMFREISK